MKIARKIILLSIILISYQPLIAQDQIEEIVFDPEKNYYIISYCCDEDGSHFQGVYIPGNLVRPQVSAFVNLGGESNIFEYVYTVKNGEEAERLLYSFSLQIDAESQNIEKPNQEWRIHRMPDSILSWRHSRSDIQGIRPGFLETGFGVKSFSLPSLTNAFASSNTFKGLPGGEPENEDLQAELDTLEKATQHVSLKTIGPKDPPDPFVPLDFLNMLIEYKEQSCDLNWVENRGICRSLQATLDNVKRQLEQGRTQTATNNLQAFLNEVEAIREQHLSPEAYALLRFNGEYLLEKLREE